MSVLVTRRRSAGARGGDLRAVRRAIEATLRRYGASEREVSLLLTDDREIRELNGMFRRVDEVTDVLAFALDEAEGGRTSDNLGDLVISVERAGRQARSRRVELDSELELLAVHGALHLLGFDHAEPGEARRMRSETRAIRRGLRAH